MLTEDQITIIRDSAERLAEANVAATNTFYANLFKAAPGVRTLFPDDMFQQSEKLWNSIVMVVESADDLASITEALRALGSRHVGYGAKPEHYPVVVQILIETIAALMKDEWSEAHHKAWADALDAVCATMLEGAEQRAA